MPSSQLPCPPTDRPAFPAEAHVEGRPSRAPRGDHGNGHIGASSHSIDQEPPPRGVPLGLRLGASLAMTVVIVLGTLTGIQWRQETKRERADREQLLVESLAPLTASLETARSRQEMAQLLLDHRRLFIERGYRHHHLELRDADGTVVATTQEAGDSAAPGDLHGLETLSSPLLRGGHGELHVWQDATTFDADVERRWRDRWIKILVAALTIIAGAQLAIFVLISRPLGCLVRSLGKLEMGYLGTVRSSRAAWEVRVLEWRLQRTAEELQRAVQRLVAAERRALQSARRDPSGPAPRLHENLEPAQPAPVITRHDRLLREYLEDLCRLMETSPSGNQAAATAATETWERWAVEAERMGAIDLKIRLENAALKTLDANGYRKLSRQIRRLTGARRGWVDERARSIQEILAEAGVQILALQHRVKHVAGVWRKMRNKDLELEEISDLFAFRVVVAEEAECYTALSALHRVFQPEPFRFKDYIERPKPNGYRSIHTALQDEDDITFEIQIRTMAMHHEAENGAAAHWTYKADTAPSVPGSLRWFKRGLRRLTKGHS